MLEKHSSTNPDTRGDRLASSADASAQKTTADFGSFARIGRSWVPQPSLISIIFKPTIGGALAWVLAGVLILVCILFVTFIVYQTGGTAFTYPYLILLPVLLAGAIFKVPGGLIAALLAASALGPLMPLDVATGTMQTTKNWLVRMVMYLIIGGFAGLLSTLLYARQQQSLIRERIDPLSRLISPMAAARLCQTSSAGAKDSFTPTYALVIAFEGLGSVLRTLGVDASNSAIFAVGKALNQGLGDYALVTRIHGATFGILLPPGRQTMAFLLSQLQESLPTTIPLGNFSIILLPRFGVAKLDEADRAGGQPFRKPMAALHLARERGKRIARYSSSVDQLAQDGLKLVWEFSKALEQKELSVHFQPKVTIASGKLFGVEALVRWNSSQRGNVSPGYFVPIIEKTTLIDPMTRLIAEQSVQELAAWHAKGLKIDLAINISAILFQNNDFMNFFKQLPGRYGISPEYIEVEITETALMEDMAVMRSALIELREFGFKIAIDDFGTGYSSFKYLKDLPINVVKLDQSFVRDLPQNKASCEIASAIASVCRRMNYTLVAEGIETEAALEFLHDHGCDAGQGYLYAKPMPADAFLAWAESYKPIQPQTASS